MSAYLYTVDYSNTKNIQNFTSSSRRTSNASTSPSTKAANNKFTMKTALNQLKPTEEQIHPSGIYGPIIKRGSLFSGLRRSSKANSNASTPSSSPSQSRKHSVDAAMLTR